MESKKTSACFHSYFSFFFNLKLSHVYVDENGQIPCLGEIFTILPLFSKYLTIYDYFVTRVHETQALISSIYFNIIYTWNSILQESSTMEKTNSLQITNHMEVGKKTKNAFGLHVLRLAFE